MPLITIILGGVLLAALAFIGVMGLLQRSRTLRLSRISSEQALRFAAEDPFDLPVRYRHLAVIASGHSCFADNVTYGQVEGWVFRAFDLHFEAGHGTSRLTRRFYAAIAELPQPLAAVLAWDPQAISLLEPAKQNGHMLTAGPGSDMLGDLPLNEGMVYIQACGPTLMICIPLRRRKAELKRMVDLMKRSAKALSAGAQSHSD